MMEKDLPEGWELTTLEKIAFWGSGGTPSRGDSSYYGGDIPWIKTGDLNESIIFEVNEYLTEKGLKNSSAKIFPKGSVGIAMYGATIGKTSLFGIDAATNQACAVAQVYEGVSNIFLHYYLKSQKENFIDKGKGGAQPNISQGVIKSHPFPLPPLAEQQRIVAKLDAAFGLLDRMKERLTRIPELLKNFRQAVLTQAVTGKLTEDIKTADWRELTLNDVIENKPKNGYSAKPVSYETPYKVLTLTATTSGNFNPTYFKYFDQEIGSDSSFWAQPDDILIQRGNTIDYVGVPAIYDGLPNEFIYPDLMIKVRADERKILTKFLYYQLSSKQSRNYLRERATGTTGNMPKINQPTLISLPISFPPLAEQQEIVRRVEALLARADAIEAQYLALKEKIDRLPQALLAQAFRGELVPQDPTDEPAAVLLGKIKAGKGKQGVLFNS